MPIHTVEEMLALKAQFSQKPFANFSLSNCIARKKQGERLERGADAWGGKHATTVIEGHRRQMQHSLNKISDEKFTEVLNELMKPEFFEPETIKVLVSSVYQKALGEPFLASLYANLCFSLSRYEVTGVGADGNVDAAQAATASPFSPFSPPCDTTGTSTQSTPGGGGGGGGGIANRVTPGSSFASIVGTSSTSATPGSLSTAATPGSIRPKSLFRATIVTHAQHEFEKKSNSSCGASPAGSPSPPSRGAAAAAASPSSSEAMSPSFSAEQQEDEEDRERSLKRGRANIKFVGHLFLVSVISMNIMKRIVDSILHLRDTPMFVPDENDMDVLTVLLTTIGSRIDGGADADARLFLDEVMMRISHLEKLGTSSMPGAKPRYTMRTRTKVMDLTDLRGKNWIKKSAATNLAGQSNPSSTAVTPSSMRSPATPGMMRHNKFGNSSGSGSNSNLGSGATDPRAQQFPDSPMVGNASTPVSGQPSSFKNALMGGSGSKAGQQQQQHQGGKKGGGGGDSDPLAVGGSGSYRPPTRGGSSASASPSPSTQQPAATAATTKEPTVPAAAAALPPPSRPISRVIQDTFKEWLCSHSLLRSWQQRFSGYNLSEEELRAAIVSELFWDACMTTRQDAQLEVVLFCKQGLSFSQIDFYPGFLKIMRRALGEGVLTDVPKFFDRLVIAMHYAAVQQLGNNSTGGANAGGQMSAGAIRSNRTSLYRQLAQLIFATAESDPLEDDTPDSNEELCDGLLRLWQAAPRDEAVEDSVVDFMLRPRLCASKFPEMVAEMVLFSVTSASVLSAEPVKRWLASADAKESPLHPLLCKNF